MMRPRWHKVIADLLSNKVRSLLVVASIAVGLFAVGLIATIHIVLSADMRTSYIAVNPANIQVRVDSFDPDFVDRVRHLPGVRDASGAWLADMRIQTGPEKWTQINLKAGQDLDQMAINRVERVSGIWPPGDREIVIEMNKLEELGVQVGQPVHIKLASGKIRTLQLVGVVHDQTIGSASGGGGFFLAPAQGYITYDTLEWLEQPTAFNTLYATVTGPSNQLEPIQEISNHIMDEFDANGYQTVNSVVRRTTDHPNMTYLDAIASVLFVLGLLVVFLSGFLITNTLQALLNQQVQQIGVMKTVGGNSRQISGIYMILILVFSLLALLISIPLAQQVAYGLLEFLASRINFNLQGYRLVPLAIYLQVAIALIVPEVAGFIPILQGTRITIQEAIGGVGVSRFDDQGGIAHLLSRIRGLSRPLLISLRNTFRRKVRLALTLLTLTLGGAIFISTFNVRSSLDNYVDRLRRYFVADVNLTLSEPYRISEVERDVLQVPGVAAIEGWAAARAEVIRSDGAPGESVQLLAPPPNSQLIVPILRAGRWIMPGDQNALVVSELFFEQYPGLKLGDTLGLKVNGEETDWVVVGNIQFAGRASGMVAYATYDYLSRLTHIPNKSSVFRVVAAPGFHDLDGQDALGLRIEDQLNRLGYHVADVRAGLSLQNSTSRGLDILTAFLMIMALLMAVVGSIGLMGTMSLNVLERTREIGIMRAIGGSDRAIMKLVLVEGVLIGLISWLLGCLVAFPISKLLFDVISMAIFNSTSPFSFTATGPLIWAGLVTLLSILASVIPARSAARLTIREVLAYE